MSEDFMKKVRGESPFPWSQIVHPSGLVQVIDAAGREVPLFTLTEFACLTTTVMSNRKQEAA